MAALPLSTLLSQVLVAFTIELDNEFERRFEEAGGGARVTSLTMWSNLLRFVGDGITVHELFAATGLPRTSVLSRVGGVERWGYVSVGPAAGKRAGYGSAGRMKDHWVVRPTTAGRRAAEIWPVLPGEIEARWLERFGAAEIDQLVRALEAVDNSVETCLPEYLPVVSSSNGLALQLPQAGRQPADSRLLVLLARALMVYALDFEGSSALSLPLSANVFRVLDRAPVPVRELPALTGISKEAVEVSLTSLRKTEYVVVEGAPASKRMIRLTSAGEKLRNGQDLLQARIGSGWGKRLGADVVGSLRAGLGQVLDNPQLSSGLTPYPDGWRADKRYALQTQAVLADPRGRLPHYPMVLHRGGWPDGS